MAQEEDQVLINRFRAQRVQHGERLGAVIGAVVDEVQQDVQHTGVSMVSDLCGLRNGLRGRDQIGTALGVFGKPAHVARHNAQQAADQAHIHAA